MAQAPEPAPVHCYTNPSFCRQSEYIPGDHASNGLPPPPQFQGNDDLPPPPPPLQLQYYAGQSNPAFQEPPETTAVDARESRDRYCYLDDNRPLTHRRYASLPVEEPRVTYNQSSRYEYIQQEDEHGQLTRRGSSRYEFIPHQQQQVQQRSAPSTNQDDRGGPQTQTCRTANAGRYALIPGEQDYQDEGAQWSNAKSASRHINTPQGNFFSFLFSWSSCCSERYVKKLYTHVFIMPFFFVKLDYTKIVIVMIKNPCSVLERSVGNDWDIYIYIDRCKRFDRRKRHNLMLKFLDIT